MRRIPVRPGILLRPQRTNPTLDPISYTYSPAREPLQVGLPAIANSNGSAVILPPPQFKGLSSDPNTSALDPAQSVTDIGPTEEEEDSPYAEVRASVSNIDDPEMPTMTFRMWFLGLTLVFLSVSLNTFFNFRYPSPWLAPSLALLIAYPFGKALAFILPTRTWVFPRILGGGEFTLNPGPFNVKEHVLIYMMAGVAVYPSYVMNVIVVAEMYYGLSFDPGFEILLILATLLTGFGLAGLCRALLVKPASMIWPQNLVSSTLLNALHAEDEDRSTGISRYRFFIYVMTGTFLWTFLPGFLFVGLSFFSWMCWMAPSAYLFLYGSNERASPPPRRKPRRQPAFWDCVWPWNGRHHLRLEPNLLHRVAAHDPLVGSSPLFCGFRGAVLDYATDPILHQRTVSLLLPRPVLTRVPMF